MLKISKEWLSIDLKKGNTCMKKLKTLRNIFRGGDFNANQN